MHVAINAVGVGVLKDSLPILHDLTFGVEPFAITGLIGPSGSGKTTLMRSIIGVQQLTKGDLTVLDKPAGHPSLRARIGYVTQSPAIYDDLTVEQNMRYFASIVGAPSQIKSVLDQVHLTHQARQIAGSLSGGERARVSLAVALLGDPQLLVLDEPTVGLDPVLRKHLWELFAELTTKGKTVLVSSHVMDEAERCKNILLLRDGQLLHQGSRQALLSQTHTDSVEDAFLQLVEEHTNA